MCGCSCSPSYLCFSAVVLFSNLLCKLEMHHFDFDMNFKEHFILFHRCVFVFLAKTAAVKSFAWFLSLSPLPTAASIHESPTRKRGSAQIASTKEILRATPFAFLRPKTLYGHHDPFFRYALSPRFILQP